jgi:hypothetical protein
MMEDYEVIVDKDGRQFLTYKGEVLPAQMDTTLRQTVKDSEFGFCEFTVTVRAKLKPSK